MVPPVADPLEELCASFKRHLRAEGKAARTQVLYGLSVRLFSEWLVSHGRPATLDGLTRHDQWTFGVDGIFNF